MAEFKNEKLQDLSNDFSTTRKETNLTRGAQAKNITIADWNTVVAYLETLLNDVSRIYKEALSEIDKNLLSNPDAVYEAVYNHLQNNLRVSLSFVKTTGNFGITLYDGTNTLCSGSVTDTGLNKSVTKIAVVYSTTADAWRLEYTLLDGSVKTTPLEDLVNHLADETSKKALEIVEKTAVLKSDSDYILYGTEFKGVQKEYPISQVADRLTIAQRNTFGNLKVPDNPIEAVYGPGGGPMIDWETGELITEEDKHSAINATFTDKRYAKKIDVSYSNVDGNLTVALKNEANETLSSDTVNIPIESTIVSIDEYRVGEDVYLKFTLRNGNYLEVALDDIVTGLAKQTDLDTLEAVAKTRLDALERAVYGVEEELEMLNEGGIE